MKKSTFLFVLLLSVTRIFAQGEFILEVNSETGTFTKQGGAIQDLNWLFLNTRTYDEINGSMILQGGITSPDHLYNVDASNGDINTNAPFGSGTVSLPQHDNVSGDLFGLYHDFATSSYYLTTIDPVTGAHTPFASPVPGLPGLTLGTNTYDDKHHRYIDVYKDYLTYVNTLYIINTQDGTTTTNLPLNLPTGDNIVNLCYNNTNDTLYGMSYETGTQLYYLVWIDTTTGDVIQIGSGTSFASNEAGSTIDEASRRFIYSYSDSNGYHIIVMNMVNGAIMFNNPINIDNGDNFHSVEYDNIRHKLFAIHWDALIDGAGVGDTHGESVKLYPNPASEELLVHFAKNYQDIHVALYNVTGQEVRSADFKQATECTFQLHDLSSGMYFLKFDTPDKSFSAQFIKQ